MRRILSSALLLLLSAASLLAQNKINPATQILWPMVTGAGAPAFSCSASNYGEPYTDVVGNNQYVCTSSGWAKINGGGGSVGPGTIGYIPAFATTTTIGNSHLDDGVTSANTVTSSETVQAIVSGQDTIPFLAVNNGTSTLHVVAPQFICPNITTSTVSGCAFGLGMSTANADAARLSIEYRYGGSVAADRGALSMSTTVTDNQEALMWDWYGNLYLPQLPSEASLATDSSGKIIPGSAGGAFSGGLGTSYQDVTEIATPANPASGNDRLYTNSTTHQIACLTSSGGSCMPSGSATQRGVNAVTDWGLDNTGATDVSATLSTRVNALTTGLEIYFPCGLYKFTNGDVFSATNSGLAGITFLGESTSSFAGGASTGSGCVYFEYNGGGANTDLMWWKNTAADTTNDNGPQIENINFIDTSNTGAVHSFIRISQFSNWIIRNDGFQAPNAGRQYTTGTVTVNNGSATVTGSGTAWVTAGLPQYGTDFQVAGHIVEVASFNNDTSLTLTSPWSYTTASGAAYAVDYNGVDVLLEGNSQGSNSYTQYGTLEDIHAYQFREFAHLQGSPGGTSAGGGAYDVTVDGGWLQCGRIIDSGALFFGAFDGSFSITNQKFQNCARVVTSEGAQAATYTFRYENTGAFTPVTTCNGLVNTSGTSVTWVSGVPAFNTNGSWTNASITIAGTAYTISSVTSGTTLTLSSSAGTQTNAVYTMPQACTAGIVVNNNGNSTLGTKNKVIGSNIVNTGTAIEFDTPNTVASHSWSIVGNGFTSNLNNYQWDDGSTGCNTSEKDAVVVQPDCTVFQTPPPSSGGTVLCSPNAQTGTAYTLVLADGTASGAACIGTVTMNNAAANLVTVPPNSSVALPTPDEIDLTQLGAGQTCFVAGAGVTLTTPTSLCTRAQDSTIGIRQISANTWIVFGDTQ